MDTKPTDICEFGHPYSRHYDDGVPVECFCDVACKPDGAPCGCNEFRLELRSQMPPPLPQSDDKTRLDWLSVGNRVDGLYKVEDGFLIKQGQYNDGIGTTLREAIDDAIRKEGDEK